MSHRPVSVTQYRFQSYVINHFTGTPFERRLSLHIKKIRVHVVHQCECHLSSMYRLANLPHIQPVLVIAMSMYFRMVYMTRL